MFFAKWPIFCENVMKIEDFSILLKFISFKLLYINFRRNWAFLVKMTFVTKSCFFSTLLFCVFYCLKKPWDDLSVYGHSKLYSSGYRRANRRQLRKQISDCDDSEFTKLGSPPPLGECIRLVIWKNCKVSVGDFDQYCSFFKFSRAFSWD